MNKDSLQIGAKHFHQAQFVHQTELIQQRNKAFFVQEVEGKVYLKSFEFKADIFNIRTHLCLSDIFEPDTWILPQDNFCLSPDNKLLAFYELVDYCVYFIDIASISIVQTYNIKAYAQLETFNMLWTYDSKHFLMQANSEGENCGMLKLLDFDLVQGSLKLWQSDMLDQNLSENEIFRLNSFCICPISENLMIHTYENKIVYLKQPFDQQLILSQQAHNLDIEYLYFTIKAFDDLLIAEVGDRWQNKSLYYEFRQISESLINRFALNKLSEDKSYVADFTYSPDTKQIFFLRHLAELAKKEVFYVDSYGSEESATLYQYLLQGCTLEGKIVFENSIFAPFYPILNFFGNHLVISANRGSTIIVYYLGPQN